LSQSVKWQNQSLSASSLGENWFNLGSIAVHHVPYERLRMWAQYKERCSAKGEGVECQTWRKAQFKHQKYGKVLKGKLSA